MTPIVLSNLSSILLAFSIRPSDISLYLCYPLIYPIMHYYHHYMDTLVTAESWSEKRKQNTSPMAMFKGVLQVHPKMNPFLL